MVARWRPSVLLPVFGGGVGGTLTRYAVESSLPHRALGWPWATFLINILGAFLLGMVLECLIRRGPENRSRQRTRLLVGTGFLGAFTTYSTFALEGVELVDGGEWRTALAYVVATVVLGAAAAWVGIVIGARTISAERGGPHA